MARNGFSALPTVQSIDLAQRPGQAPRITLTMPEKGSTIEHREQSDESFVLKRLCSATTAILIKHLMFIVRSKGANAFCSNTISTRGNRMRSPRWGGAASDWSRLWVYKWICNSLQLRRSPQKVGPEP